MKTRGLVFWHIHRTLRGYAVLGIFFLSAMTLFCQVKIKEKVEIRPKTIEGPQGIIGGTWIGIEVEQAISSDGYYYIYGGSEYLVKLKLIKNYRDPETGGWILEESDFPQSQLFSAYIRVYEDNVEGTAIISGEDTCMYLSGIQQGFRILVGNGSDKDTSQCYLEIETVNGTRYSGSVLLSIIKSQLITSLEPTTISAGDTVKIFIKRKTADGVIREFFPEQQFEAGILDGCDYGKFIWPGLKETVHIKKTVYTNDSVYVIDSIYIKDKDSVYVKDIKQPIIFVASDSFDTETPAVKLRIGVRGNECYDENVLLKKSREPLIASASCNAFYYYPDFSLLDFNILKPEIEIIYPTCKSKNEEISEEPQMPEVTCKARVKDYDGGSVKFEWEYWVSYELLRYYYKTKEELCKREGKVEFIGNSTANNSDISEWKVEFANRKANYIKYKAAQPKILGWKRYGGNCDEVRTDWEEGDDIFIGGYVWVKVTAKDSEGKVLGWDTTSANKIIGLNPSNPNTIFSYANLKEIKAIIKGESRTKQFNISYKNNYNNLGYPIYGSPNGYELMQLDNPPPAELQLWNWKSSLDGGKARFKIAENSTIKYLKKGGTYDNEIFLKNAFQHYNSNHFYYYWDYIKKLWLIKPYLLDEEGNIITSKNYGGRIYTIYESLNN